ncbi:MAG: xenobiotic compound monooxygenase, DszA family, subunit [Hyphomicrobiales bacterium]|nr:xenobiotic compound monooxygenase, DszA family, subunit [Hyphomicrobiales bacterium]
MAASARGTMNLGVFFKNTGHHIAAWRHPDAQPDAGVNARHYVQCAITSERACFDFLFFADSAAVRDTKSYETLSRTAQYTAYFEPTTLLGALAMVTERIGLVSTATTSYNEPYHVARRFASLDWLSAGRAGWNVVTSGNAAEALNFGRDEHYGHAARYHRAREFVDVVRGLWDSWDDDAFLYDRESGRFFDPARLHVLDHQGEHFKVRGPLNVPRPPQGHPVIFQAGTSEDGRELAAATADAVFTSELTREDSRAYYKDVKSRMARHGRTPDQMRIMPGCTVFCAPTEAEARERYEHMQSLIDPVVGRAYIADLLSLDLSDCDIDGPLPDRPSPRSEQGTFRNVMNLSRRDGLSIRQIYQRLAGSHGKLCLVGSTTQVADVMQDWFESEACDGFILQPSTMPGDLDHLAATLVPELQGRGLHRTAYEGTTLRSHLGLARPASRYKQPA